MLGFAISAFFIHNGIDYFISENYICEISKVHIFEEIKKLIQVTIKSGTLITGFYYFILSMLIVKYANKISNKVLWSILFPTMILCTLMRFNVSSLLLNNAFLIFSAGILFIGISRINFNGDKIYSWLRYASSLIYFSHRLFIFIYNFMCSDKWYYSGNNRFIFTVCGTCALAFVLIICYEKYPNNKLVKLLL